MYRQKGLPGLLKASAIVLIFNLLVYDLHNFLYYVVYSPYGYFDGYDAVNTIQSVFFYHYAVLLLIASIVFLGYNARKPLGLVGGLLLLLESVLKIGWNIVRRVLVSGENWELVNRIGNWVNPIQTLLFIAAFILIAIYVRHKGMLVVGIIIAVLEMMILATYQYFYGAFGLGYEAWAYIGWGIEWMCGIMLVIYLFMWSKNAKIA